MHRWKISLLAAAAALSSGLYATNASALTLGRVSVQSALGEPLRAQIALPNITAAEADSLHVSVASPEVFRSQGLEYSPTVHGIRLELRPGAGGTMVLHATSNSAVNDPFIDLVIDAAWNAGHIVRSYTLLFDPPALRSTPAPAPIAAQTAPSATAGGAATAAPIRSPGVSSTTPAARPAAAAAPAAHSTAESSAKEVKVHTGDTAGAIASAHRPGGVSLDQMLVAMVRANPQAFTDGNANRLRSGAILQLPSKEDAQATPAAEARKIIAAQSQDFNAYRQRLAGAAPAAAVQAASRSASGKIQTEVSESKPAPTSSDKLTLSKGESASAQAADARTADAKQANETSSRLKELSKNIEDLKSLSDDTGAAPTSEAAESKAPAPETASSQSADAAPAAVAAAEPAVQVPAPAAAPVEAPKAETPLPAAAPQPSPAPAQAPEPSLLDSLTEDPLKAGGALALVLLLLGWGGYRYQQSRRNQHSPETTFADDADHPDSFFAESGGQEVDTTSSDLNTGSTSTLYSPSQLDQIGDVDPVAEADVYLAYGKDPEAEAILKEAALAHPEQISIPAKLAEIYAKRQDRAGLEFAARKVHELSHGQGIEWERVRQLGAGLDGDNALYRPAPAASLAPALPEAAAHAPASSTHGANQQAAVGPTLAAPDSLLPEINLDLDLDAGASTLPPAQSPSIPGAAFAAAAVGAAQRALEEPAPASEAPELTLNEAPAAAPQAGSQEFAAHTLDFPMDDLTLADSGPMPLARKASPATPATTQPAVLATQPAALEFDLGDLSLDLGKPAGTAPASTAAAQTEAATTAHEPLPSDPLATKLALAEEFKAIGDSEGARSLIEEVMAQASPELKVQAQRLLDTLG